MRQLYSKNNVIRNVQLKKEKKKKKKVHKINDRLKCIVRIPQVSQTLIAILIAYGSQMISY